MKQEIFPFMPLSYGNGHKWILTLPGLYKAMAFCQGKWFIPQAMPYAFPFTNPHLACLTSQFLFFKHYFMVLICLFYSVPTERLPAHSST